MGTDIKSGETASADIVMNALGSQFQDTAQLIFNADYTGFDSRLNNSTTPNLKNVDYSTFTSDDGDTGTTMKYDFVGDFYFVAGDVIDEINDSSVDTNLWSKTGAGTLAENTSYLTTGNITDSTSTILLDQTNAPNLKDGDSSIYTHTNFTTPTPGNTGKSFALQISDGTNTVSLVSFSASGTVDLEQNHTFRVDVDVSAETVDLYIDGALSSSDIDISTLTGSTWNLRWTTTAGGIDPATTAIQIYYVYQIKDSTTATGTYVSQDFSSSETITNAILVANTNVSANATATYYLSADGTNWETVTPSEIHRFTNTGTTMKVKVIADPNKQTDVFDYFRLTEFADKHNFY